MRLMAPVLSTQLRDIIDACLDIMDIMRTQYDLEHDADMDRENYSHAQYASVASTILRYDMDISDIEAYTTAQLNDQLKDVFSVTKTLFRRLLVRGQFVHDQNLIEAAAAEIPQSFRFQWKHLVSNID